MIHVLTGIIFQSLSHITLFLKTCSLVELRLGHKPLLLRGYRARHVAEWGDGRSKAGGFAADCGHVWSIVTCG